MIRVPITDAIREELNDLHQKTSVGPQRLLKGKSDRPKGLSSTTIYHWIEGKTVTAEQDHLNYVLREWRKTEPLEAFTEADLMKLDQELKRTGYAPASLLRRLSPVPNGLTPDSLHLVRSKRLKKLPASHIAFLFEGLEKLPNR